MKRAVRRLTRSLCVLAAIVCAGTAQAQIGVASEPVQGPALVTCTNMEILQSVPCPDSQMFFHDGGRFVQESFGRKDFARLDALYEQWCSGKDRFPDGRWKLFQYGVALDEMYEAWQTWSRDLDVLKAWRQAQPQSEAALYAEAIYWRAYAWKARGGGYAGTVSKEGWELFHERLAKSSEVLTALRKGAIECPAPHALALGVLTDLGAAEDTLAEVYTEASRRWPEYHNLHFAMARHYEPKWGGSEEAYEAFAEQVARQTKAFEGMGMYARLYWLVDSRRGIPFLNDPSRAPDWKKLQAGYEDLMRLYPSSLHNLGKYAGVACRSGDSELYRRLRSRIAGYEHTAQMLDPVDVCDRRHQWTAR